ncbi:hypothetical protein BU26DRAFT_514478 [Trematosphaeria pertusa]|uniref:SWR1-complex protein 3 domain-containing protein n=1 Tax=Trematosphaeria pertusa TaxID=390896 RepID=A0A6A6IX38_9PLEO|nr:uncharacterized protein BU26DRAFT_514478 [Trematosphaeria pertusa]KAF2254597.1 hypothetical protein BU26DRAFT_514478 [Trematosphaeria pertusa]
MSEPRRSTRARTREEAAAAPPPPETPKETPSKQAAKSLKRKRTSLIPADEPTPTTPAAETSQPQAPKLVLPIRVVDGQPLPTLSEPQPLDLPSQEYQDIQQSGVLSASLQRSRAVWISGVNFRLFHALFTPPKKVADRSEEDKQNVQRQKEIVRNFPLVGEAQLVIEPHTFTIRLYGPREAVRQVQKKAPTYGQWPNHNQQSPYQYNHAPPASYPNTPQQRPSQPKPPPPKAPAPAPNTKTPTPAPDPVIHMLAQRAGQDPELKAVMKIVAAGQATKEQLEFFQGHISELTNILQKQKEAAAKAPAPPPPPPPPPQPAIAPPPPQPISQPVQPVQLQPQNVPKSYSSAPPQAHQPQMTPAPPQHPPHPNQYTYSQPQQYQQAQHAPQYQAPKTYRPLIFDFVEGNGDKFYFPSYSFMEWLPNHQGAKFSFLVTKLKPKLKAEAKTNTPSTPGPKAAPSSTPGPTPSATPNVPMAGNGNPTPNQNTPTPTPLQMATPAPVTPYVPPPRIEDYDEKNDMKDVDFYQPVTVLVFSGNPEILQSLPRALRPPDVVDKYMNEVFDTCRRADETYLAFRLPKEGGADAEVEEKRTKSGDVTPAVSTPMADVVMGGMGAILEKKKPVGRPRKSLV